jgi:hypothetical protein
MPGPKTSGGDFERKVEELFEVDDEDATPEELSEPLEEDEEK